MELLKSIEKSEAILIAFYSIFYSLWPMGARVRNGKDQNRMKQRNKKIEVQKTQTIRHTFSGTNKDKDNTPKHLQFER